MTTAPDRHTVDAGAYVLGSLDPAERAAFERHLPDCPTCERAVAELAGLPALLASVPQDVAESLSPDGDRSARPTGAVPLPPRLLDGVLARAAAEHAVRRRRRILATAAAAAAVVVLSMGALLTVTLRDDAPAPPEVQTLVMEPVDDGPLAVTALVQSVAWGTRIELECSYDEGEPPSGTPPEYSLVVRDDDGTTQQVGTWMAVPGRDITVQTATAVRLDNIESLEVQTADGRPILTTTG